MGKQNLFHEHNTEGKIVFTLLSQMLLSPNPTKFTAMNVLEQVPKFKFFILEGQDPGERDVSLPCWTILQHLHLNVDGWFQVKKMLDQQNYIDYIPVNTNPFLSSIKWRFTLPHARWKVTSTSIWRWTIVGPLLTPFLVSGNFRHTLNQISVLVHPWTKNNLTTINHHHPGILLYHSIVFGNTGNWRKLFSQGACSWNLWTTGNLLWLWNCRLVYHVPWQVPLYTGGSLLGLRYLQAQPLGWSSQAWGAPFQNHTENDVTIFC